MTPSVWHARSVTALTSNRDSNAGSGIVWPSKHAAHDAFVTTYPQTSQICTDFFFLVRAAFVNIRGNLHYRGWAFCVALVMRLGAPGARIHQLPALTAPARS